MLIPTLSILKIFATSIGVIIAYYGYKRWKETKLLSMEYFWKAILWHSLDCVAIIVMPLLSFNLYFVQILWDLNLFTGTIYYAYLLALLLLFLEIERLHLIAKNLLIIVAPLNLVFSVLSLKPAIVQTYPLPFSNFNGIIWLPNLPFVSVIFAGVGTVALFAVFIPLLVKKVSFIEDPLKRQKGIYIVLGVAGLFLAAIFNWFVGPVIGYSFWKDLVQGLLCASGQIFFGLGMLLKRK